MPFNHAPTRLPTRDEEASLHRQGYPRVAGVDEVGRGPLAGPVVAAAVVLPPSLNMDHQDFPLIRDSKTLTPSQRERGAALIQQMTTGIGIGAVSSQEIDRIGIVAATRQAMEQALQALPETPDYLLIDALPLAWRGLPCTAIIRGDQRCTAIAAASVVAKVHRDALMVEMDAHYPGYGFASHKGYASPAHLAALQLLGPCPIHRQSFKPLRPEQPAASANPRLRLGTRGERIAARYLEGLGYEILTRNFRTLYGEVDLVTRHGESIVFVEVRTRRSLTYGTPEESVTARKRQRLEMAAQQYLQDYKLEQLTWRIDLVSVCTDSAGTSVSHLQGII